ncbi:hypothetical protein [Helicobacter japonicus]|nr:hypothetical protein [Helicobacter japonicus]
MLLLSFVLGLIWAEDSQLHQLESLEAHKTLSDTKNISNESHKDFVANVQASKNFSIKVNTIANEGYSEFELETGKANLNEFEASMSRYGAGIKFDYSFRPDSRVKLNFFLSNALEINTQRRGGKVKAYDDTQRYEENTYDYGSKVMYPVWANSIGMAITILNAHRIVFTLKQTQLSTNDMLLAMNPKGIGIPIMSNVSQVVPNNYNLYAITTQIFLTYSYVF